jgi:hypothetical protein
VNTNNGWTFDDSIPTNANGVQVGAGVQITPTSLSNFLEFSFTAWGQPTIVDSSLSAALFRDAIVNALAIQTGTSGQNICHISFTFRMQVPSLSLQTYYMRAAPTTGNVYINGNSVGTRRYGGVSAATFTVKEVLP